MNEAMQASTDVSQKVVHIIEATTLHGEDGLFMRVAEVARELTQSKHGIVVVEASAGNCLQVVGCSGEPRMLMRSLPKDKGVIGAMWKVGSSRNVRDVKKDDDYVAFDEEVESELAVAVTDAARQEVELLLNVESSVKAHFSADHENLLYFLGDITRIRREEIARKQGRQSVADAMAHVLDELADEVLVIDRHFRPLFANKAKLASVPALRGHLKWKEEPLGVDLYESTPQIDSKGTCHFIIEGHSLRCDLCICARAMELGKPQYGCYKPELLPFVTELSAAPLFSDGKVVGAVETLRKITQRERVLDFTETILGLLSTDVVLKEVCQFLHNTLEYSRVRLYSIDPSDNGLHGCLLAGRHDKVDETRFKTKVGKMPAVLDGVWLAAGRAGLIRLNGRGSIQETLGYWECSLDRFAFQQEVDPNDDLEFGDVVEIITVTIRSQDAHYIIFADSKYNSTPVGFTHDDLQALSMLARIVTPTLIATQGNELRFKMAVLGETTGGLIHELPKYFIPEGLQAHLIAPFKNLLQLGKGRLKQRDPCIEDQCGSLILDRCSNLLAQECELEPEGSPQIQAVAHQLAKDITSLPLAYAFLLAQFFATFPAALEGLRKLVRNNPNSTWLPILGTLKSIIVGFKDHDQKGEEVKLLAEALRSLVRKDEQLEKNDYDIFRIVHLAAAISRPKAAKAAVSFAFTEPTGVATAHVNAGQIFLGLLALLDNAVRSAAQARGERLVTVEVGSFGDFCRTTIANTGDRIPPEKLPLLGKVPFSGKACAGAGLGLRFTYDWMEANNGTIQHAFDEKKQVTFFTVNLPMKGEHT